MVFCKSLSEPVKVNKICNFSTVGASPYNRLAAIETEFAGNHRLSAAPAKSLVTNPAKSRHHEKVLPWTVILVDCSKKSK